MSLRLLSLFFICVLFAGISSASEATTMTMEDMLSTQQIELATRVMHDFVTDGQIKSLSAEHQEKLRRILIARRPELLAMLQSTTSSTRALGAWALGFTNTHSATKRLSMLLFDEEASVRVEVLRAYSVIGSRKHESILARFANDADLYVRVEALKTMRILGFGWDAAIAHLNDTEAEIRREAVLLLTETAPDVQARHNAEIALKKLYESIDVNERVCAVSSLGLLRMSNSTPLFMRAIFEEDVLVAIAAARALGDVGAVASIVLAVDEVKINSAVRDELIMQLGRYLQTHRAALDKLIEISGSEGGSEVALGAIGMSASRMALKELQKTPLGRETKIARLFARARLGEFAAASKLLQLTSSRDSTHALRAADALMRLGNPAGMSVIIDSLASSEYRIRLLAAGYLAMYASAKREFGSLENIEQAKEVRADWLAWWITNQHKFHPISSFSGD